MSKIKQPNNSQKNKQQKTIYILLTGTSLKLLKYLWKGLMFLKKLLIPFRKTFAEIAVIVSFVVAAITLSSYVGVTCETPLNPSNVLYTTPFIIENKGLLPIYSVKFSVLPREMLFGNSGKVFGKGRLPSIDKPDTFAPSTKPINIIRPNERATIFVGKVFNFPDAIKHIDIDIVVNYLDYFSFKREKHLRFVSSKNPISKNLTLFPQSVLDEELDKKGTN